MPERLIDADKLKLALSKELISVERKLRTTKLDMAYRALEVVDESPAVDAVSREQYDQLKHKFEAAMRDLQRMAACILCKHHKDCDTLKAEKCEQCINKEMPSAEYEWRGVCKDNEGGDAE